VNRLMDMNPLTAEAISELLQRLFVVRLVTAEEDARLTAAGLRYSMPQGWDGSDIFARYSVVGIEATSTDPQLTATPNHAMQR
jgi:hypothetical protein